MTDQRRGVSDDEIRSAREKDSLISVIGRDVVLTKRSRLYEGLCPFHAEKTPSFKVDPDANTYRCYGCGASGDLIAWRRHITGESFVEAVRALNGSAPLPRREIERRETTRRAEAERKLDFRVRRARRIWREAVTIANTPGEAWLRGRGIVMPLPPTLRYHPNVLWGGFDRDNPENNIAVPALVCAVQNPAGMVTAIHATYFDPSTLNDPAPRKWPLEPQRVLVGDVAGGAVRLTGQARPRMGTGEGLETCLSVLQAYLAPDSLFVDPPFDGLWMGIDRNHMELIVWPDEVESLIVFADRDPANARRYNEFKRGDGSTWRRRNPDFGKRPGEESARKTCAAFVASRRGRIAAIGVPPGTKTDFNDLLTGRAA